MIGSVGVCFCFHPKLMFWTDLLEKYDAFTSKSNERRTVLKEDPWINKRTVSELDGATGKAAFSLEEVSRAEYERKVGVIINAWNASDKDAKRALAFREEMLPHFVEDTHPYYDHYCHALTFLHSEQRNCK